jgi:hypothetical protein
LLLGDLVYSLDGQDTTLTRGSLIVVTRTTWKGDRRVTEDVFKSGSSMSKRVQEWSLSADGKVLTVLTIHDGDIATRTRKQVYDRK